MTAILMDYSATVLIMMPDETTQAAVLDEYFSIKSLIEGRKLDFDGLNAELRRSLSGRVLSWFMKIIQPFNSKMMNNEFKKAGYDDIEPKAADVITNQDLKCTLCKALRSLPKDVIVTEKVFISVLTKTLCDESLLQSLEITFDLKLFGMVGNLIYAQGVEKFCQESTIQ